jgi:hypothetical protein
MYVLITSYKWMSEGKNTFNKKAIHLKPSSILYIRPYITNVAAEIKDLTMTRQKEFIKKMKNIFQKINCYKRNAGTLTKIKTIRS